ncbi:MAG TPA: hypothetical protein VEQ11_11445 [Chloroflexota bacterium]|nr:hypothetical protein [Chloroflexota bacterium]
MSGASPGAARRRRPISPRSPLQGRQLWRVGDWGGASEHIGQRWETLGALALQTIVGQPRTGPDGSAYLPRRALVLATEAALAAAVQATGKPHPDAILLGEMDGQTVMEPVDFKWTLETANPKQVGREVLAALLDDPPPLLETRLAEGLADLSSRDGPPAYHDGIFLAPDHAANRAFLAPSGPLDPAWAVLSPVDPLEFFEPLPSWEMARALANLDHARIDSLEAAERYYRLGAGVLGGIRRLRSGIFGHQTTEVDGPAELARLRRARRLIAIGELIAYLDRALAAQRDTLDRLGEVERAAYPFSLFRQDLAARGLATAAGRDRRWGHLYGGVMKALAERYRAEGRRLVAEGRSDSEAVVQLDASRARWTAVARRLLEERVPSST